VAAAVAVGGWLASAVVVVLEALVLVVELTLDVLTGAPTVTLVRVVEMALDLTAALLLLALPLPLPLPGNKRAPQTLLYPGARALLFM